MEALVEKQSLIEPGVYDLAYSGYETVMMFGRSPKLVLNFAVVSPGEAFGWRLRRHYNVKRFKGKPGKNGKFVVSDKSDFAREYARVFTDLPPRMDCFPMSRFENTVVSGKVETVIRGHDQKPIPPALQYSRISELVELVAGNSLPPSLEPSSLPSPEPKPTPTKEHPESASEYGKTGIGMATGK